ncbi:MAG: double-strand break repair protein AddB, partial [Alphaproteobacteria bacterium]
VAQSRAEAWRLHPPDYPIVAAGSTGSIPATADLLATVADLPEGSVVLPGLDRELDDESWRQLGPSHPQYGLAQLLERLGVARADVPDWRFPGGRSDAAWRDQGAPPARLRLISETMRPAETTNAWIGVTDLDARALEDVALIDCPGSHEEAGTIALVMREALEQEGGGTCALVTPDRNLARRVVAELRRWGVWVDDSAGTPLADTAPGSFLRLTARMVADEAAPVPLLAALKHPLAAGGLTVGAFRARARALERVLLRGPRPAPGLDGLLRGLAASEDDQWQRASIDRAGLVGWVEDIVRRGEPLARAMAKDTLALDELLHAHLEFAEAMAATPEKSGAERIWAGDAGEAVATFVSELTAAAEVLGPIATDSYPAVLEALMSGRVVRPTYGTHPRLAILGPLEARLQRFDVMILGGLNEGTWPPEHDTGPWMSRPMQSDFGLPLPERRVGLSAHDFCQAFCAGSVVMTRAERVEGTPTVPSRWLARLQHLATGRGLPDPRENGRTWRAWQRQLDRVSTGLGRREPRPAPAPPVEARPRHLSVTQIETWMRDPYAIYARHILRLRALDPIDALPDAARYGTLVHRTLEEFMRARAPFADAHAALGELLAIGERTFQPLNAFPGVWSFWWPRFQRAARSFVEHEAKRGPHVRASFAEVRGELPIEAPAGPFTLSAVADRIDRLADGGIAIIDYKTGKAPGPKEVAAGFAPQLPLEAAIAVAGGFAEPGPSTVSELLYWQVRVGADAGPRPSADEQPAVLAGQALAGFLALVAAFDDPATPYESRPRPEQAPRYSDYEHLARIKEWASGGPDEDE